MAQKALSLKIGHEDRLARDPPRLIRFSQPRALGRLSPRRTIPLLGIATKAAATAGARRL